MNSFKSQSIWASSTLVVMARVTQSDQVTLITSGVVQSITRTIGVAASSCDASCNCGDPVWTVGAPVALTAGTVFSALKTDNGWTVDAVGYNFRDVIPASSLAAAGQSRVVYLVTLNDGTVTEFVVDVAVKPTFN